MASSAIRREPARAPSSSAYDEAEVRRALELMVQPGALFELRVLDAPLPGYRGPNPKRGTCMGIFSLEHLDEVVKVCRELSGKAPLYFVPNPLKDGFNAHDRMGTFGEPKGSGCVKDPGIARRRWIFVDMDPVREPKGVSATDEEKAAAFEIAKAIREWLDYLGWPAPVKADGGNSPHLLYRIDLDNSAESTDLVAGVLKALAAKFTTERVNVDTSVSNPARVWKLYGTLACKGKNIPERPHRLARILHIPEKLEVVSEALLKEVWKLSRTTKPKSGAKFTSGNGNGNGQHWNEGKLLELLQKSGLDFRQVDDHKGGPAWLFEHCPLTGDIHDGGKLGGSCTMVGLAGDGIPWFKCHGARCVGKGFKDLADHIDPERRIKRAERERRVAGSKARPLRKDPGDNEGPEQPPIEDRAEGEGDNRPEVIVDRSKTMSALALEAEAALLGAPELPLYQRARRLVRVVRGPSGQPLIDEVVKAKTLRPVLDDHVRWVAPKLKGEEWRMVPLLPPVWVCETLIERPSWSLPELKSVSGVPVLLRDGRVITKPGFDADSGIYFSPSVEFPEIAAAPTRDDARAALELLAEPFKEFNFAGEEHRAAAIAVVLSQLAVRAIVGNIPMVLLWAREAKFGKTLLAQIMVSMASGAEPTMTPPASSMEEEGKRILSFLRSGHSAVIVDNIQGGIGGEKLEMLATGRTYTDRILRETADTTLPNDTHWLLTGNQPTFIGDFARRVLCIQLNENRERFDRSQDELKAHCRRNHPRFVAAGLTVLSSYIRAGKPRPPFMASWESFDDWSNLIRGCLMWLGLPDPYGGTVAVRDEGDIERRAFRGLLRLLHARFGEGAFKINELRTAAETDKDIAETLATWDTRGERQGFSSKLLGQAFHRWKEKNFGGIAIKAIGQSKGVNRWVIYDPAETSREITNPHGGG